MLHIISYDLYAPNRTLMTCFLEEHVPELGRRKSEVVKEALENVTHLIELSDGINTRAAGRRNRGTINRDELGLSNLSPLYRMLTFSSR